MEAQRGHGSPGTPAAARRPSVYHLTPRPEQPARVHVFHLPPSGGVCSSSPVGTNSPSAHARREPRTPATQTRSPRGAARAPRPLATQRLAGQLVARCHGLGRGHVGAICDALTGAGIDPAVWSAADITGALEADMRARGWCWPDRIERRGAFWPAACGGWNGAPKGRRNAAALPPRAWTKRRGRGCSPASSGSGSRRRKRRSARCWRAGQGPGLGRRGLVRGAGNPSARSWAAVNQPRARMSR